MFLCYRWQPGGEKTRAAGRGRVRRGREVEVPAEGDDCCKEAGEQGRPLGGSMAFRDRTWELGQGARWPGKREV